MSVNNTLKLCTLGYYCPLDEATGEFVHQMICPDGHFCWTGSTEPMKCSSFNSCTGDAMRAGPGGLVLSIFLCLILLGLCACSAIRNASAIRMSQQAADEFQGDSVETFGQEFKFDIKPVSLEFVDMGMVLKSATAGTPPLLQGVSARFPNGSLGALMGPSGKVALYRREFHSLGSRG